MWKCPMVFLAGCSFAFGSSPRTPTATAPGDVSCGHYVLPAIDALVAVVFVAGAAASAAHPCHCDDPGSPALAGLVGALYAGSAAHGVHAEGQCRMLAKKHDELGELLATARGAAAVNDCATVAKLDARACVLDSTYHARVFARDPAIARCPAEADAVMRCTADRPRLEHEQCVARRREIYEAMKATSDPEERQRLYSDAPRCNAPPPSATGPAAPHG